MKSLVLAALLAATAVPALAQSTAPANSTTTTSTTTTTTPAPTDAAGARAAVGVACAADFKAQCPNSAPGSDEMKQCVRENFDKMSDGCKGAIMTMMSQGGDR